MTRGSLSLAEEMLGGGQCLMELQLWILKINRRVLLVMARKH